MRRGLLISGNGSWDSYGNGTLARINGNYDVVVGMSTGSLSAPMVALNQWEMLRNGNELIKISDVFDIRWYKIKPVDKYGRIRKFPIIITLILGNKTIYTSNKLRKSLDYYINEDYFYELRSENKEILVGSQNYSRIPPKIQFFSSMVETCEEFKDWMWCSANFPFYGSLVKKSWRDSYGNFHVGRWNGGVLTDLDGLNQLIDRDLDEIDIVLHRPRLEEKLEGNHIHSLIEYVSSSIQSLRNDYETQYFYEKIHELNKNGTKVRVFWLPRKLSLNPMAYDNSEMDAWWDEGYATAFEPRRLEIFEPISRKF
jgi:hypothetical protein